MTSVQERRMIGPYEAADLLKLNTKNRRLDPKKVTFYARQMREGKWKDTGVPIIISRHLGETVLDDGQYRLSAIIESGETLPFTISVTDERVFDVVDGGKARTLGDLITINDESGERVTAKRAAAVGIAVDRWMRDTPSMGVYASKSNAERMRLLTTYRREAAILVDMVTTHKHRLHRLPHAGFLAGALEIYRADARADRFFDQIYLQDEATVVRGASSASALMTALAAPPEKHGQFFDWCRMWNNLVVSAWMRRDERGVITLTRAARRWLNTGTKVVDEADGDAGEEEAGDVHRLGS